MLNPFKTLGALVLGLGLWSCGEPEATVSAASLHVKLVDDTSAQLAGPVDDFEGALVLQEDFGGGRDFVFRHVSRHSETHNQSCLKKER